jgi:hypothetical protein
LPKQDNLIFNTCRQSGDHGPINSWDRQPFLTDVRNGPGGAPSYDAALTDISSNFVIANYGASQGVDNDDGSSWYDIHDNFFFDAEGLKQDFGGHDSRYHHNVNYVVKYDGQQCLNSWPFVPGHQHHFHDNKCVVSFDDDALRISGLDCDDPMASAGIIDVLYNNSYYTPNGSATANDCKITVAQMSANGSTIEQGSSMHFLPTDEVLFGWAREKLGMPPAENRGAS